MEQFQTHAYVPPYQIVILYNGLNETAEAFTCLDRGFEQHAEDDLSQSSGRISPQFHA